MRRPIPADDTELIRRSRELDHAAFGELLRRHDPAMRRLAFSLLHQSSAIDDALQDAYLQAFRGLGGFRGDAAFSSWLYRIVYRSCLDRLRRRRPTHSLDEVVEKSRDGHFDATEQHAVGDTLRRALGELRPDHRAALMLVDGEGYSYEETAAILQTTKGTVASRVSRARAALRSAYERESRDADDPEGGAR